MKKKIVCLAIALIMTLSCVSTSFGASFFYGKTPISYRMDALEEFILEVQESYKDEVSLDTLFEGIYEGLFQSLDDRWSVYYQNEPGTAYYSTAEEPYVGIGIVFRGFDDGELLIRSVVPGSPADRAGLRTGDIITKINTQPTKGTAPEDSQKKLLGPAGTSVTLTITRDGNPMIVSLTRTTIKNETVEYKMLDDKTGYIGISEFLSGTADEFKTAKAALLQKGAKKLIIDLRGCPGGLVMEAADIAGQLIPKSGKTITKFIRKGEVMETLYTSGNTDKQVKTICLTDSDTASAAELLAAALKENGAAVLIGETTYGKGVAQIAEETVQDQAYRLSVYYFTTPQGNPINEVGVTPHIAVKNSKNLSADEIEAIKKVLAPMTENRRYRFGETGLNVYAAQQRLQILGYDVDLTAALDEKTKNALMKVQAMDPAFTPYGGLDFGTMELLARLFEEYLNPSGSDLQLEKAMEY